MWPFWILKSFSFETDNATNTFFVIRFKSDENCDNKKHKNKLFYVNVR